MVEKINENEQPGTALIKYEPGHNQSFKLRRSEGINPGNEPLDIEQLLLNTPTIPDEVYQLLPEILKNGAAMFQSAREKDVFLTSALTILSGIFPTIVGEYDSKRVHPNLYSFIIAPAASGKSALIGAKDLVKVIHNDIVELFEQNEEFAQGGSADQMRMLFIPGNISAAAIIAILKENNGKGIIVETEADSMSNSLKQEWGSFSDLLRKAFHHESVSYARKKDNQYIELKYPKLSVSLSGTPDQVPALIKSINDGLFSRFIFYTFRNLPKWKNVAPDRSKPVYEFYMAGLQSDIKAIYEFFRDVELDFDLKVFQWMKLNRQYEGYLRNSVTFISLETSSIVLRLGLIQFRIAMVLSVLRHYDCRAAGNKISCSDLDYSIAEVLCDVYLQHALLIYKIMSKHIANGLEGKVAEFYKALPILPFRRKDAVAIADKLGISERSVSSYLRKLVENRFLVQDKPQGEYKRSES